MPFIYNEQDPAGKWKGYVRPTSFDNHIVPYSITPNLTLAIHPRDFVKTEVGTILTIKPKEAPTDRVAYIVVGEERNELKWARFTCIPRNVNSLSQVIDFIKQPSIMDDLLKIVRSIPFDDTQFEYIG